MQALQVLKGRKDLKELQDLQARRARKVPRVLLVPKAHKEQVDLKEILEYQVHRA